MNQKEVNKTIAKEINSGKQAARHSFITNYSGIS